MNRVESLMKMLESSPDDVFLHYAMAMEFQSAGDDPKAIEKFEWIRQRDPAYLALYYQLAKLYEQAGLKDDAIDIYEKGIQVASEQKDMKTMNELRSALEELTF